MLGTYAYNEIFRKTVIAFGTLFNNIEIRRAATGATTEVMKVPLAYGPKDKFLARLAQAGTAEDRTTQITLPRISFEISGFSYDTTRKVAPTQIIRHVDSSDKTRKAFMPVPYNMDFELVVMAKQSDDALQIVEQILPFFQPDYTITLNDNSTMGTTRDVPIILTGVTYSDEYEGSFEDRRVLTYTLSFTAKFYLYGPVTDQKVIKQVQVDQYTDLPVNAPKREQRYTVTPSPVSADADDNFGFNETTSFFEDAKNFDSVSGTDKEDA